MMQRGQEESMDPDHIQAIAARDQLWSSLRSLRADIERLADGHFDGTQRDLQIAQLLARIVSAEMKFRDEEGESGAATPRAEM
jgi:hypothetical protein